MGSVSSREPHEDCAILMFYVHLGSVFSTLPSVVYMCDVLCSAARLCQGRVCVCDKRRCFAVAVTKAPAAATPSSPQGSYVDAIFASFAFIKPRNEFQESSFCLVTSRGRGGGARGRLSRGSFADFCRFIARAGEERGAPKDVDGGRGRAGFRRNSAGDPEPEGGGRDVTFPRPIIGWLSVLLGGRLTRRFTE